MNKPLAKLVGERAHFCCEYCFSPEYYCPDPFVSEHIGPESKGGGTNPDNLAFSCAGCNGHKYNFVAALDPGTGQIVPLYNPRNDAWPSHFRWNEDFTYIIGISPIGRATVLRLRLNRPNVVNLRRLLIAAGEHPPLWF